MSILHLETHRNAFDNKKKSTLNTNYILFRLFCSFSFLSTFIVNMAYLYVLCSIVLYLIPKIKDIKRMFLSSYYFYVLRDLKHRIRCNTWNRSILNILLLIEIFSISFAPKGSSKISNSMSLNKSDFPSKYHWTYHQHMY